MKFSHSVNDPPFSNCMDLASPKTLKSALKNLKSQLNPVFIWTNLTIGTLAAGIPITLQTTLARKVRNCLVILSQAFFCSSLEILIVSTPLSVFFVSWRPEKKIEIIIENLVHGYS